MLEIIIQVVLAILLLLIMAILAYSIYDREYINNISLYNTNRKKTLILDGIYPYSEHMIRVETINRLDPNYFDLNPSINQNGGAEYTFNFWLYYNLMDQNNLIDTGSGNTQNKYIILFTKGDLNLLNYNQFDYACDTKNNKKYLLIKNPLVKLKNDGTELIVEYNNINYPDTFNSSARKIGTCTSTIQNQNKLGIKEIDNIAYNKTWNMITIVMQENPKNEDELFVNRTNCKVYFNATLIADRSTLNNALSDENNADIYSTVMKKNSGNLYINPNYNLITYGGLSSDDYTSGSLQRKKESDGLTDDIPLKIANLSYYNYSLNHDEILKLYKNKFNTKLAKFSTDNPDSRKIKIGDRINYDMYNGENPNITLPVKPI